MPALVEIECPHCQATLKLKSRQPLGKKVPCPKCRKPFVAKEKIAAAATADSVDDYDDYDAAPARPQAAAAGEIDDFSAGEFDDLGPAAAPKRSKRRPKKKSGMPAGLKWTLVGGGVVFGLSILGVGIWLIAGMFFKSLDLAWLPPDANRITVVRVSEIWNSDIVQDSIKGDTKDAIKKMKKDYGIEPKDIVSVTTASDGSDSIKVVRTSIDMDPDKILENATDHEEETYGGEDYYKIGRNALYFPDKRTAISGSEESVKKAIDRGPDAEKRDDLKFVDAGYQIVKIRLKSQETIDREAKLFGEINGFPIPKTIASCEGRSITSSFKQKSQQRFASVEDAKEYEEKVKEMQREMEEKIKDFDKEAIYRNLSEEEKREMQEAVASFSVSTSRSGDVINTTMTFTPTESMRKKGRGLWGGLGSGGSEIRSIARSPNQLFGISRSSFPTRRPVFGGRRPNIGINRGGTVRKWEISVGPFRGNGDEATAAMDAVKGLPGINHSRTTFANGKLIFYSEPGRFVSSSPVTSRLRAKGFRPFGVRSSSDN